MIVKLLNLLYTKSTLEVFVFNICFPCFDLLKSLDREEKEGSEAKGGKSKDYEDVMAKDWGRG